MSRPLVGAIDLSLKKEERTEFLKEYHKKRNIQKSLLKRSQSGNLSPE